MHPFRITAELGAFKKKSRYMYLTDRVGLGHSIRPDRLRGKCEDTGKPIDYYMKVIASVEPRERPERPDPWHGVELADQFASAIHDAALGKYAECDYANYTGNLARADARLYATRRFVTERYVALCWQFGLGRV